MNCCSFSPADYFSSEFEQNIQLNLTSNDFWWSPLFILFYRPHTFCVSVYKVGTAVCPPQCIRKRKKYAPAHLEN